MIGFEFANTHSDTFGIYARSVNRTIKPSLRKNEFVIPGRHGTIDYEMNTYDKRPITVEITMVKNKLQELRSTSRDIAQWLNKSGMLVFDDEPDKVYNAKIYNQVDLEQIATRGVVTLIFECQPFAESLQYNQVNTDLIGNPVTIPVEVTGTAETPCIITIKNNGLNTINSINITRKAAI